MTNQLDRLAEEVCKKLRFLGFAKPSLSVLRAILETAFIASIKTEENRFVRGSLSYSDPAKPDPDPPIKRRANYPSFRPFAHRTPLNVNALVKFSRAIDAWSGSITVYGTKRSELFIWGLVDQQVRRNVSLNKESDGGYGAPGIVTINIEGVGDISVYHQSLFLGRLRQSQVITKENDVLHSQLIADRITPTLEPAAISIARVLKTDPERILLFLFEEWVTTVSRICIGLRRLNTGGALLFTPKHVSGMLDIVHRCRYDRLGGATILRVLDDGYIRTLPIERINSPTAAFERRFAETDARDRAEELTGAVKIVTSLAAVDGLVLSDFELRIAGFGVKINASKRIGTVFDGSDFVHRGTKARIIDVTQFGTRHASMLRYCQADRNAIGVVISQDGHTRLIASNGGNLLLWDNVKLLGHADDLNRYAHMLRERRVRLRKLQRKPSRGYTKMPKTIRALLSSSGLPGHKRS